MAHVGVGEQSIPVLPVLFLLMDRFCGFSPAWVTLFTDQVKIWQGGADFYLPNFTLIGSGVWV